MFIPTQGFRHASTLLLTNRIRVLVSSESPKTIAEPLAQLAEELAGLAEDMKVPAEAASWLVDEYGRAVDLLLALVPALEGTRAEVKARAGAVFAQIGRQRSAAATRDLFLVHVPEDRLPLAGPLGLELTKRGLSVALSEYEVETPDQLLSLIERGLSLHRAGAFLWTPAFLKKNWPHAKTDRVSATARTNAARFAVLRPPFSPAHLAEWSRVANLHRVSSLWTGKPSVTRPTSGTLLAPLKDRCHCSGGTC